MNKRCTNPSCRKTFSTLYFNGRCPHCGKRYPQLYPQFVSNVRFCAVRIIDHNGYKVKTIKIIRELYQIGLKQAKCAADYIPDTVFLMQQEEAEQFIREMEAFGGKCSKAKSKIRSKGIFLPKKPSSCEDCCRKQECFICRV